MRGTRLAALVGAVLIGLAPVPPTLAQSAGPATVGGSVADALGRPVAGAAIRLEGPDGRAVAKATSDAAGRFAFPAVPPGPYAVSIDKEDFETGTAIVSAAPGAP